MRDVEVRKDIEGGPAVLSEREVEVFQCLADGLRIKEISQKLSISARTIETHRANVLKKTEGKSIIQVCIALYKKGIIQ